MAAEVVVAVILILLSMLLCYYLYFKKQTTPRKLPSKEKLLEARVKHFKCKSAKLPVDESRQSSHQDEERQQQTEVLKSITQDTKISSSSNKRYSKPTEIYEVHVPYSPVFKPPPPPPLGFKPMPWAIQYTYHFGWSLFYK